MLNLSSRDARHAAAELLDWFGLADAASAGAKTYSGGMRRRLDLAASLVGRPRVIFLDEPTTGLDPAKREDMWEVVRRLVTDGSTVLLTTQYLEEADALADEITVIDRGRVIAHNTPEGLKRTIGGPADPGQTGRPRPAGRRAPDPRRDRRRGPQPTGRDEITVAGRRRGRAGRHGGRLAAEGIAVTELSLHLPSLDEVFLTLTGQNHRRRSSRRNDDPTHDTGDGRWRAVNRPAPAQSPRRRRHPARRPAPAPSVTGAASGRLSPSCRWRWPNAA